MKKLGVLGVLVISVAVIGMFARSKLSDNQAGTDKPTAAMKVNTDKPVVDSNELVHEAAPASVAVAAPISAAKPRIAANPVVLERVGGGSFFEADGDVFITEPNAPIRRVTPSDKIVSGTVISVGDKGYAILVFDDDQIVHIQPNTTLHVRDYRYDIKHAENNNIDLDLLQGGLHLVTGKIGQLNHKAFKLITPSGAIDIRGTEFSVVVDKNKKSVYTKVKTGSIGMTNNTGTAVTAAGESARTTSADAPTAKIPESEVPPNTFKTLNAIDKKSGAKVKAVRNNSGAQKVAQNKSPQKNVVAKHPDAPESAKAMLGALVNNDHAAAGKPVIVGVTAPTSAVIAGDNMADKTVTVKSSGGHFVEMEGDISIAVGNGAPRLAAKSDLVTSDTVVSTGDKSHVLMKFDDGEEVALQDNTTLHVRAYNYEPERAEKNQIDFSMLKGGLRFITGLIGQANHDAFKLSVPTATVGIRGTVALVAIAANGTTYVQVVSGGLAVTGASGATVLVGAGQALAISASGVVTAISAAAVPAGTFSSGITASISGSGAAAGGAAIGGTTTTVATGAAAAGATVSVTAVSLGAAAAAAVAAAASGGGTSTVGH